LIAHELQVEAAPGLGLGLAEKTADIENRTPDRANRFAGPGDLVPLSLEREAEALVARAVEGHVAESLRELVPGLFQVDAVLFGHHKEMLAPPSRPLAHMAEPGRRAVEQGEVGLGDDQVGIDAQLDPQPVAVGAHPAGRVEAEQRRAELGEADVTMDAGVVLAEEDLLAAVQYDDEHALPGL
jgi:hypothetical protein